jgi:Fic-DOC domain mobile mystery protein B
MSDVFDEPEDATPLEPSERQGLLQSWIISRGDLNEAEQANIAEAMTWLRRSRKRTPEEIVDPEFGMLLHARMFGDVWEWAGQYRQTERNIGVAAYRIAMDVRQLADDARYWIAHAVYGDDELAIRFHHRLVAIHPFPNGNGRLTRLLADVLITRLGGRPFSWGGGHIGDMGAIRQRYVAALRAADAHDLSALLDFARS